MNTKSFFCLALSFCFPLFLSSVAKAEAFAGAGYSSATSGRPIPTLLGGWSSDTWAASLASGGARSSLYAHSHWTGSLYAVRPMAPLFGGSVTAGIGVGAHLESRTYRETTASSEETAREWTAGPAFRVHWRFLPHMYLSVEAMFGFKNPLNIILLSAQDLTSIGLGIEI